MGLRLIKVDKFLNDITMGNGYELPLCSKGKLVEEFEYE